MAGHKDDGMIHMTQAGLTDRIIKALNIKDLPLKQSPAEFSCQGQNEFGDPPHGSYSYHSVIGMLQYLPKLIVDQTLLWPSPSAKGTRTCQSGSMRQLWNQLANI